MSALSDAIASLKVARSRSRGQSIPLSKETAQALGVKGGSISLTDADKLIEKHADEAPEPEADATPATKPKGRKGKAEVAEEPVPATTEDVLG